LPKYKDRGELRSLLAEQGVVFSDKIPIPPEGLTLARARIYQENLEAKEADELIMANARPGLITQAAELAGGLLGGLADPINFIPFAGGVNRALTVGTRVFSRAGLKILGRSALIGAGENVAGAAMSDALAFPLANRWGADLGWEEAAAGVAFSGVLGSMFSTAGTIIGKRKAGLLNRDALIKAVADIEAGRPVDTAPILEEKVRGVEAQRVNLNPATETGRMTTSDHPHGWNGPDRAIVPVEAYPLKSGEVSIPQRLVVSSLVYNPDGTLHIAESRKAINKVFTGLLESWGLEPAGTGKGTAGARKVLPTHQQTGWPAEIGKGDLREILNTAKTEADFIALEKLPEIWRTSAYEKTENWAENKKKGAVKNFYKAVHKFKNVLKIGDDYYRVNILVKETVNGRHYYYQKLARIKDSRGISGSFPSPGGGSLTPLNLSPDGNLAQASGQVKQLLQRM